MDIKITLVRHSQLCGTLVMNNLWMPLPKTPRLFGVVELLGRQLSWISGTCFVCPCKGMVNHWGRNRNVFCEVVFICSGMQQTVLTSHTNVISLVLWKIPGMCALGR